MSCRAAGSARPSSSRSPTPGTRERVALLLGQVPDGQTFALDVERDGETVGLNPDLRVTRARAARLRGRSPASWRSADYRTEHHALAEEWRGLVDALPPDWSHLLAQVDLDSSDFVDRAAMLIGPTNPVLVDGVRALQFRSARLVGYGVSVGMAARCLERLDGGEDHRANQDRQGRLRRTSRRDAGPRVARRRTLGLTGDRPQVSLEGDRGQCRARRSRRRRGGPRHSCRRRRQRGRLHRARGVASASSRASRWCPPSASPASGPTESRPISTPRSSGRSHCSRRSRSSSGRRAGGASSTASSAASRRRRSSCTRPASRPCCRPGRLRAPSACACRDPR